MRPLRHAAVLPGLALALAACSPSGTPAPPTQPQRPEAQAAASALAGLGLGNASFASAKVAPDVVELDDVRGDLAGRGPVRARTVVARGARTDGAAWRADELVATDVATESGDPVARELRVKDLSVAKDGGAWKAEAGDVSLSDFDAPVMGTRLAGTSLQRVRTASETRIDGAGIRLRPGTFPGLPQEPDGHIAGASFDVRLEAVDRGGGNVDILLERLSAPGIGSVRGEARLSGMDAKAAGEVLGLGFPGILGTWDWPASATLRRVDLRGQATVPGLGGAMRKDAADPAVAKALATLGDRLDLGGSDMSVVLSLPQPAGVRDFWTYVYQTPEAARGLGLAADLGHGIAPPAVPAKGQAVGSPAPTGQIPVDPVTHMPIVPQAASAQPAGPNR